MIYVYKLMNSSVYITKIIIVNNINIYLDFKKQ